MTASVQALVPPEVLSTKQKNGYKDPPLLTCGDCGIRTRGDHLCLKDERSEATDSFFDSTGDAKPCVFYANLAESHGLVLREVTIREGEKCRCLKKNRGSCAVCAGSGIIAPGTVEMRWATPVEFNPNSPHQVKRFTRFLKHPVPKHAKRLDADWRSVRYDGGEGAGAVVRENKAPDLPVADREEAAHKDFGYLRRWLDTVKGWKAPHHVYLSDSDVADFLRAPNVQNGIKHLLQSLSKGARIRLQPDAPRGLRVFDYKFRLQILPRPDNGVSG